MPKQKFKLMTKPGEPAIYPRNVLDWSFVKNHRLVLHKPTGMYFEIGLDGDMSQTAVERQFWARFAGHDLLTRPSVNEYIERLLGHEALMMFVYLKVKMMEEFRS